MLACLVAASSGEALAALARRNEITSGVSRVRLGAWLRSEALVSFRGQAQKLRYQPSRGFGGEVGGEGGGVR